MRWSGRVERLLFGLGLLMLGVYVGARIHSKIFSRIAVHDFEKRQEALRGEHVEAASAGRTPDFSLWSAKRVRDYEESLTARLSPPAALLRIPKIGLEVPVLEGTDDVTLNRGVGLITGTARPGEVGNIGIAGHRDGFFRGLKDVGPGDVIELATEAGTRTYVIDRTLIVSPDDVSVLRPGPRPTVTLVTCYPFYFVGSAPQRYVVEAFLEHGDPRTLASDRTKDDGKTNEAAK